MTYKLTFLEEAFKEWNKLSPDIRGQFKKKLEKCLISPHIKNSSLSGMADCYKIKLRTAGYRLIYRVFEDRIVVQVVAVGKRDKNIVYKKAHKRI